MNSIPSWLLFAGVAFFFWGLTGITQKLSTDRISSERSFLWFSYAMIAVSLVLCLTVKIGWKASVATMVLSVAGGLLNGAGVLTSFAALESGGKVSVVIPLVSLYPLLTVVAAVLFLHEHPSGAQILGLCLAVVSAVLLTSEG